jgi:hypothetical protein
VIDASFSSGSRPGKNFLASVWFDTFCCRFSAATLLIAKKPAKNFYSIIDPQEVPD